MRDDINTVTVWVSQVAEGVQTCALNAHILAAAPRMV